MDTDSFILEIKTQDLEKDLEYFKNEFDFSDLDKSHPLYSDENLKVIGKFKIETLPHLSIDVFIVLRAKSYALSYSDKEKAKQKGIQKTPKFDDYKKCLFNNTKQQIKQIIQ